MDKIGTKTYKSSLQLNNYWATNQSDMSGLTSWCYDSRYYGGVGVRNEPPASH